jgi:nucleoside-diphosphate-sugar epimerase
MTVLVVGASGATGRLLVQQLLDRGQPVRAVVRTPDKLPEALRRHPNVAIVQASLLALDDAALAAQVRGCRAVASCLGHTLSWRGVFGPPHRLVRDATRRLCDAIRANRPACATRFVLMNTAGNRGTDEPVSFAQRGVLALLRLLLPPHADNEQAAEYLRTRVGARDAAVEWAAVRPDGLVDEAEVSPYTLHPSPTRSAIFDAGTTSRINVAHFMAALATDDDLWNTWKGRMPVIYNRDPKPAGSKR